jgi:lysophospholipase L1-like esterase
MHGQMRQRHMNQQRISQWRATGCAGVFLLGMACSGRDGSQSKAPSTPVGAGQPAAQSPGAPAGSPASNPPGETMSPGNAAPTNNEGNPAVSGIQTPEPGATPGTDPGTAPAGTPAPRFVGRVDTSDAAGARFAWSGTGVVANFTGSSVAVRLTGGQQYTVLVDGVLQPKLLSTGGSDSLASGLAQGTHSVEIYRRTEADQGEAQFLGFDFAGGKLLPPPPAPQRRIEVLGDSISAGYGDEGANMDCHFTPDTENHYLTYGALAARTLGAELSTVAWSGKGVVCNYGDDASSCSNPMPTYYDRVLPARTDSQWRFSDWQPQAVVINLGTNDFSTVSDPSQQEFEQAYGKLLEHIRGVYPEALILATVGPLLNGADLTTARTYINDVVQARNQAGDAKVKSFELTPTNAADGYGCDWHPSLRTHQIMADTLVATLRTELGW